MKNVIERLKDNYIFAVVRGNTTQDGLEICKAAVKGGIKNLEVTFSTPQAEKVISQLVDLYKDDNRIIVGAGTVMSVDLAKKATEAGAKFLVSPHFDEAIAQFAEENQIPYMPGCATTTEIVRAMKAQCEIIKIFPGGLLGPKFIKDIHGPIPEAELMPSGGVSLDNFLEWKNHGAVAVGVGSALTKRVAKEGYESVSEIASQFVKTLK